jgi:hypothetical protein
MKNGFIERSIYGAELLSKLEPRRWRFETELFAIGAVLFVGLDVASLSAVGAFARGTGWLLDRRGGSRRGGESAVGFCRDTTVMTTLLLLSCNATFAVFHEAVKFLLDTAMC